jgi:transformation/transcription domain-associated protein
MIDTSTAKNQEFLMDNNEYVPFRMTPNIQNFITPIGMEGIFTSSVRANNKYQIVLDFVNIIYSLFFILFFTFLLEGEAS